MYHKTRIPHYPGPKLHRVLICLLKRRRLILGILVGNLIVCVFMYISSSPEQNDLESYRKIGHKRMDINAGEFLLKDGSLNNGNLPHQIDARKKDNDLRSQFPGAHGILKPHVDTFNYREQACDDLVHPPKSISETYHWYPIEKLSKKTFVFSAYLDTRTIPFAIKIHGISFGSSFEDIYSKQYCQIWYHGQKGPEVSRAQYEIVPETHDYKYAPAMFVCYVRHSGKPTAVSLTSTKCSQASHFLPVIIPPETPKPEYNFTVCLSSPINFHFDDVYHFVETVELNRLLGADKIVLYNHTIGPQVERYIKHYVKDGIIDVIPWNVPVAVNVYPPDPLVSPEIHYFAQVTSINDCLYRYMYRTEYIIFLDLDEFLVPRTDKTWKKMMEHLNNDQSDRSSYKQYHKFAAYLVRNVFFRIDWPDDESFEHKRDTKLHLLTQLKLVRESKIWDWYTRTKCVIMPSLVDMMGVHFVFSFVDNSRYIHKQVDQDVALLHHYRDWGNDEPAPPREIDPYMLYFKHDLQEAVIKTHNQMKVLHKEI